MWIYDVKFDTKDDPVLKNSSQEQSTSSKYDCVLDSLLIILGSWKLAYHSMMTYCGYLGCQIWYQRWLSPPKLQSETINVVRVWLCSWWTNNHAKELKIWINLKWQILFIHGIKIDIRDDPILQNSSQETTNALQTWLCNWCTFVMLGS